MNILGLNHGEINSSAALYKDGKIVAGVPEERFNRQKKTKVFPAAAIQYCLDYAGITMDDVDAVAQAWNPGAAWEKYDPLLSKHRVKRADNFYAIPDNLFNLTRREPQDWVKMSFPEGSALPPVYHIQHHRTHAANAFYLSPFEEAAVLTADWRGEFECMTMGLGKGTDLEIFAKQQVPHSLGMLYAVFTELLGYRPDSDEWKVMALSAYDLDCSDKVEKLRSTIKLEEQGQFTLDQSFYKGALVDQPRLYTDKLVDLLGGRQGVPGAEPDEWYITVAKAMQTISEDIATHMLTYLAEKTKCKNVVVSGGFFMNSVYNGKLLDKTPFEDLCISYAPSDVGNSIGAALYVAHTLEGQPRDFSFNSSYIGPSFDNASIRASLERRGIAHEVLPNPAKTVASLLARGEIVAHFDGRMEFGERALGNRSILGDPRSPIAKDKINSMIKYREAYRPFAPAAKMEHAPRYFEVEEGFECHFMEKVVPVRREYREQLPAITHVDGSGRLQTVKEEHNPRFYSILSEMEVLTGMPIVLNTSFNINGEPIVLSPDDALSTFYNSGLQYLIMGEYLVKKA